MNIRPGDMIIYSPAHDLVARDIQFNIPRGVRLVVPGEKSNSVDLFKLMSEGKVLRLDVNSRFESQVTQDPPAKVEPPPAPPLKEALVVENGEVVTLRETVKSLRAKVLTDQEENGALQAENSRLKAELEASSTNTSKVSALLGNLDSSKLSELLTKLDCLPATAQSSTVTNNGSGGSKEDDDIPMFIPNFDGRTPKRVTVKESSSDGSNVEEASKALSAVRKKRNS